MTERDPFQATQYHQADGGLLPCGHYYECLECVDHRELKCGECGAVVNDDTWMCCLCYPHGALKCGHALEMRRDTGCVECRLEDQLEKVGHLAAALDDCNRMAAAMRVSIQACKCECDTTYAGNAIVCPRCIAINEFDRLRTKDPA